ncbi:MAG: hypothetical protein ACI9DJ_003425 [Algoriphagus sp.]|jgi:hypothetical protein
MYVLELNENNLRLYNTESIFPETIINSTDIKDI